MKFLRITTVLLSILFVGCASNPMQVSQSQNLEPPGPAESQVIFMRSSFVGSAINASLYDITGNQPEFIGIIANGTKVAYDTKPGKRVFMVVAESADFMEADLAPGKSYYSIVTPRMGVWKARFSAWPIKADANAEYSLQSDDFDKWLKETKLVQNTPKSTAWYQKNKAKIVAKQKKYWPVWQEKSEEDLAKRTLNPEDGR